MSHSYLRLSEVVRLAGYRRSTLYAMMSAGKFPKQIQIGPRRVVWDEAEVRGWVASRILQHQAAA